MPTTLWSCPMHPEETSVEPGRCSQCGMDFEERVGSAEELRMLHGSHAGHDHGSTHPWEWAGVFEMPADGPSTWTFQKVDGAYADGTMQFCWMSADSNDAAGLEGEEHHAEECYEQTAATGAETVQAGATLLPNKLYTLTFDLQSFQSSWFVDPVANKPNAAFFLQHFPLEFESKMHFLQSMNGDDVERVALLGEVASKALG